jgi:hypothetical protein
MSKHTPGPWRAEQGAHAWFISPVGQGYAVAATGSLGSEADARLIAASPDLLAALKELVRLKAIKESDPDQHERLKGQAWDDARAAIRAAEGEGDEG